VLADLVAHVRAPLVAERDAQRWETTWRGAWHTLGTASPTRGRAGVAVALAENRVDMGLTR
jgi:hypothetical protein